MNINIDKLLEGMKCECGKLHTCNIETVIIRSGAIEELRKLTENYRNILIVADSNTYKTCGDKVCALLGEKTEKLLVYEGDGILVPNEEAIEKMKKCVSENTDLIIGIGSGVIQDLCKYVSFAMKLKYFIVATAPSMDGYASKGAALIIGNMKMTYDAHVPAAIIGDTDILKNAPLDMMKSGYGDIIGKYSCLNDWKLSRLINGEYFCDFVYNLTYEMLLKTKDLGRALLNREEGAVQTLMEALVGVGIAMAYVGNSRPASGSEHHMSHFFEVTGIMHHEKYFMHGIDVAYSAVYTQGLREQILALDKPRQMPFDKEEWTQRITQIYGPAAEGVIKLQNSVGSYEISRYDVYAKNWKAIKAVLREAPSRDILVRLLKDIELDVADFEKTYGAEKIQNAIWFAKDLKDRYTVLRLYYDLFYEI